MAPSGARNNTRSTPALLKDSMLDRIRGPSRWNVRRRKMSPNRPRDQPKMGMSIVVTSATKPTLMDGSATIPSNRPISQSMRLEWFVMKTDEPVDGTRASSFGEHVQTRSPHHENGTARIAGIVTES